MPYKVYADGDRWDAADANLVMQQSVMTFPTVADRDAAIPSPTDGMTAFSADGGLFLRAGGAWLPVPAGALMANGIINGGFETGDLYGWSRSGDPGDVDVIGGDAACEGKYGLSINYWAGGTQWIILQSATLPRSGLRPMMMTCMAKAPSGVGSVRMQVVNIDANGAEIDFPEVVFMPTAEWGMGTLSLPAQPAARFFAARIFSLVPNTVVRIDDIRIVHSSGTHAAT